MNAHRHPVVMLKAADCSLQSTVQGASVETMKKAGCDTCSVVGCSPLPKSTVVQDNDVQDSVIDILTGSFYNEVCDARGKATQDAKKKAVTAIVALGVDKALATRSVQNAFESIREQQRDADRQSRA